MCNMYTTNYDYEISCFYLLIHLNSRLDTKFYPIVLLLNFEYYDFVITNAYFRISII